MFKSNQSVWLADRSDQGQYCVYNDLKNFKKTVTSLISLLHRTVIRLRRIS